MDAASLFEKEVLDILTQACSSHPEHNYKDGHFAETITPSKGAQPCLEHLIKSDKTANDEKEVFEKILSKLQELQHLHQQHKLHLLNPVQEILEWQELLQPLQALCYHDTSAVESAMSNTNVPPSRPNHVHGDVPHKGTTATTPIGTRIVRPPVSVVKNSSNFSKIDSPSDPSTINNPSSISIMDSPSNINDPFITSTTHNLSAASNTHNSFKTSNTHNPFIKTNVNNPFRRSHIDNMSNTSDINTPPNSSLETMIDSALGLDGQEAHGDLEGGGYGQLRGDGQQGEKCKQDKHSKESELRAQDRMKRQSGQPIQSERSEKPNEPRQSGRQAQPERLDKLEEFRQIEEPKQPQVPQAHVESTSTDPIPRPLSPTLAETSITYQLPTPTEISTANELRTPTETSIANDNLINPAVSISPLLPTSPTELTSPRQGSSPVSSDPTTSTFHLAHLKTTTHIHGARPLLRKLKNVFRKDKQRRRRWRHEESDDASGNAIGDNRSDDDAEFLEGGGFKNDGDDEVDNSEMESQLEDDVDADVKDEGGG